MANAAVSSAWPSPLEHLVQMLIFRVHACITIFLFSSTILVGNALHRLVILFFCYRHILDLVLNQDELIWQNIGPAGENNRGTSFCAFKVKCVGSTT